MGTIVCLFAPLAPLFASMAASRAAPEKAPAALCLPRTHMKVASHINGQGTGEHCRAGQRAAQASAPPPQSSSKAPHTTAPCRPGAAAMRGSQDSRPRQPPPATLDKTAHWECVRGGLACQSPCPSPRAQYILTYVGGRARPPSPQGSPG
jgi:hypothetical protein